MQEDAFCLCARLNIEWCVLFCGKIISLNFLWPHWLRKETGTWWGLWNNAFISWKKRYTFLSYMHVSAWRQTCLIYDGICWQVTPSPKMNPDWTLWVYQMYTSREVRGAKRGSFITTKSSKKTFEINEVLLWATTSPPSRTFWPVSRLWKQGCVHKWLRHWL